MKPDACGVNILFYYLTGYVTFLWFSASRFRFPIPPTAVAISRFFRRPRRSVPVPDMKMKKFVSKALEVNLAATRARIEIPPDHREFIALSRNHFGIHKRAEELLKEYHHP